MKIYYFGSEGSFSHEAAVQRFGRRGELIPAGEIADVFASVKMDSKAIGVVPIENSAQGAIYDAVDQIGQGDFIQKGLLIVEELSLPITLSLLVNPDLPAPAGGKVSPGSGKEKPRLRQAGERGEPKLPEREREQIRKVYSHPYPLSLCRDWIRVNLPRAQLVERSSTSEAARAAARDSRGAAIANRRAARIYQLKLVIPEIKNLGPNVTNFFVIGRKGRRPTGKDKTGIVFSLEHRPGSLYRALGVLNRWKINMTRIISRPRAGTVGEYYFFVEVEGHQENHQVSEALRRLKRSTLSLSVLGSYPWINLS